MTNITQHIKMNTTIFPHPIYTKNDVLDIIQISNVLKHVYLERLKK